MSDEYIRKADVINIPLPDKSERNYITYNHDDTYEQGYQEALDKAASLPPADVVPVVRCKDCKYWDDTEAEPLCEVLHDGDGVMYSPEPDDFCSYGERREE